MSELTGATRHRKDWRGRLILQVEIRVRTAGYGRPQPGKSYVHVEWRDARVEDMSIAVAECAAKEPQP